MVRPIEWDGFNIFNGRHYLTTAPEALQHITCMVSVRTKDPILQPFRMNLVTPETSKKHDDERIEKSAVTLPVS